MKRIVHAFFMCQSMFCAIPCPCRVWDEDARPLMLPMLPLVGLEIGALWAFLGWLTQFLGLPVLIRALILALWPYLATGFLHLDGFMDVTDAVRSYRSLERRREILKDSHVGSFAVIGAILLILTQFAASVSLYPGMGMNVLILLPVVSRCCSVLAIELLPPMATSQYAQRKPHVLPPLVMLVLAIGCGFWMRTKFGLTLLFCVAGFCLALLRAYRSLKGMNGDISGYCLTIGELTGLVTLAFLYR